ncbi:WD40-repeat-containing domain protein [Boeremia exigua]|uniref:WD40-repeat-containing domain protein n=1 Tax=Boeremia exigua TaxID=749465 RepID=UPI001E8EB478|nr:WD40-repeat-containing domain protein [Boeremia exigua]KAH6625616.1 WD40-repeat-containing domain protein [Boeremia exigua]
MTSQAPHPVPQIGAVAGGWRDGVAALLVGCGWCSDWVWLKGPVSDTVALLVQVWLPLTAPPPRRDLDATQWSASLGSTSSTAPRARGRSVCDPRRACTLLTDPGAVTDYGATTVQWMRSRRPRYKHAAAPEMERPSASYIVDMAPPAARVARAAESIPAKAVHSSLNKVKHPINVVKWTPEGRRLLTGSTSGEFTLWNGMGFNFETIMQAHEAAIRCVEYTHTDDWLLSADQTGVVKYWQTNFNNVKEMQAHAEAVRGLAIAPTDSKFVTCADDTTLKIWDFASSQEELTLTGHGWEVKSVDWHPHKGLLVSGSKDHQVKFWDPRTARCLTTLHGHKNPISKTMFEPAHGNLLATCARDHTARIFDLRMMRDVLLLRGHEKDIITMAWHPMHKNLLSTGGVDGSIHHYLLDEQNAPAGTLPTLSPYDSPDPANAPAQPIYPAHSIQYAHDFTVWTLDWHPLGHILASGSNDRVTRFWTRPRPGDTKYPEDRYHIGQDAAERNGTFDRSHGRRQRAEEEEQEAEDEAEGLVDQKLPAKLPHMQHPPFLPPGLSLPGLAPDSGSLPGLAHPAPPFPPGPPPPFTMPGAGQGQGQEGWERKRAPLPDQGDALQAEMRQGRYRKAR